jgi:hypothetical protein
LRAAAPVEEDAPMRTVAVSLLLLLTCAVPAGGAEWERATYPAVSGRAQVFRAAAAFGEEGVWAAGYTYGTVGGALEFRTLIQRWDGSGWSQVPTPDRETAPARNLLFDVAADGPASAWAVGHSATAPGNGATRPLVLRWDGATWSIVDDPPGFQGGLVSVAAAPDGTVWIAGSGRNPYSGYAVPVVWLRVAGGWQSVPFPTPSGCHTSPNGLATRAELSDIVSRGVRATWAAGRCVTPDGNERGFLVRFNGSRWLTVLSPEKLATYGEDGALSGLAIAPEGDVWAVGWASGTGTNVGGVPLTFRGRNNHVKPVPTPVQGPWSTLQAVAVGPGGAAVAAGSSGRHYSNAPYPFLLGDSGAGWLIEPADQSLVGNLYGVALQPSGAAWAVGVSSWDDYGLILRRRP